MCIYIYIYMRHMLHLLLRIASQRCRTREHDMMFLILNFHRGMNIDFWFWGFCMVCEVNFPTTFREQRWFPSLLRSSFTLYLMTSEDGTHNDFRNVFEKFTSHPVQKPQNQKSTVLCCSADIKESIICFSA
jgi:hypothetical protein